jgi:hypothetical protein
MDENRNTDLIIIWKPEGRRGFERPNVDGNIEIYIK